MSRKSLKEAILATMKSEDVEGPFELYATRTPGYLLACLFAKLHIHPIAITLVSILLGMLAAYLYYPDNVVINLYGIIVLLIANWLDCADGQLARMTGKKTLIGRILDGFAGDIWFFCIYFFICLRLTPQIAPWGGHWGIWIWLLCAWAGFHCHGKECAIADYYRNIHMYFQKGKSGSELDTSLREKEIFTSLHWKSRDWFEKLYLFFYINYIRGQEKQTPEFQKLYAFIQKRYGDNLPEWLRREFRQQSKPLMKWCNILTFDTRVGVLFISLLIGLPWIFPVFEIVVLEPLRYWVRRHHENICKGFIEKINAGYHG